MFDFVIQEHVRGVDIHWDLMLRCGEKLLTWQIPTAPQNWGAEPLECKKIFDHRLEYLIYEGPISKDRGFVSIVARGQYVDPRGKLLTCLPFDDLEVILNGDQLSGRVTLARISDDNWTLSFAGKESVVG